MGITEKILKIIKNLELPYLQICFIINTYKIILLISSLNFFK